MHSLKHVGKSWPGVHVVGMVVDLKAPGKTLHNVNDEVLLWRADEEDK